MTNSCAQCQATLPPETPGGLCVACLLQTALSPGMFGGTEDEAELEDAPFIEGYRMVREIGQGGFGIVYEAEQIAPIRRRVAIKVLKPGFTTRHILARFEAERQALARLDHPHIARVYDAGETDDGRPFISMELIEGCTIGQMPPICAERERLELFLAVCRAVAHAHRRGIIHRDLKPSNVLITRPAGERWTPKIIDFGIAKALDAPLSETPMFTAMRVVIGTPGYMSPEQGDPLARGADTRVDTFALGAILHEMLTGTPPEMKRGANGAARCELRTSALPREVACIIAKATETEVEARYPTADALADDVDCYLQGRPVAAAARGVLYLLGKWARRHRVATAACVITTAALIIAGVALLRGQRVERAALLAEAEAAGELRRAFSGADFEMGANLAERGRLRDAIAQWCRALRTAPANRPAAARILDALQTQPVLRPEGAPRPLPRIPVKLLQVSASGRSIVTFQHKSEVEHSLRRWVGADAAAEIAPQHGAVLALAVADNGHVLMGEADGTVRAWLPDGELRIVGRHSDAVRWVALGADGERGVSVSSHEAFEWRADGRAAGEPLVTQTPIVDFTSTPFIEWAAFAENSGAVHFRNWLRDDQQTWQIGGVAEVAKIALSPDGRWLAAATPTGVMNVIDTATGVPTGHALNPGSPVRSLSFSTDVRWLAAELQRNAITCWTTGDWRLTDVLRMEGRLQLLGFTSDGGRVAATAGNGNVRLWSVGGNGMGDELPPAQPSQRAAISALGSRLVVADPRGESLRVFATDRCPRAEMNFITGIQPTGIIAGTADTLPVILVADKQNELRLHVMEWTLPTELPAIPGWQIPAPPRQSLPGGGTPPLLNALLDVPTRKVRSFSLPVTARSMKLCAHGKALVAISAAGDEMVWLREGQAAIRQSGVQFVCGVLSADGSLAATGDEFGQVTIWQAGVAGAMRRASFGAGSDPVTAIAFAGEGSLVTGARNSTVRIWRWNDGTALSPTLHVPQTVAEVAASADGGRVAAACENGTTVVWGFKGWKAFTMPKASGRQVNGITFSSDGSRLWISWGDGRLDMHPLPPVTLPPPDFAERAEQAIGLRLGENDIEEVVSEK